MGIVLENYEQINPSSTAKQRWFLPILSAILLVPVLIWMPLQSQKNEFERLQARQIADTLWAEQAIRNRMRQTEVDTNNLAADILAGQMSGSRLTARAAGLLEQYPEMARLTWLDSSGTTRLEVGAGSMARVPDWHARSSGDMPHYVLPGEGDHKAGNLDNMIVYVVPLVRSGQLIGSLDCAMNLGDLLYRALPWWFAQGNQISIVDNVDDQALATRSDSGDGRRVFVHTKGLNLPGLDLAVKADSVAVAPHPLSNMMVVLAMLLAGGLCWSLWALRTHDARRVDAERSLARQLAFRLAMENSLQTGLAVRNLVGEIVYVNPGLCTMLGYTRAELTGQKPPYTFWAGDAFEQFCGNAEQLSQNGRSDGVESELVDAHGNKIPVLVHQSALTDAECARTGWMTTLVDISEQKASQRLLRASEDSLQRSARLATMGELSSVLAHELNQPMTAISTYSTGVLAMLQDEAPDRNRLEPALQQVQRQAHRAAQIIRSLHDFVVKRTPRRVVTAAPDLIRNLLPLLELQAKSYACSLKTSIDGDLPRVLVDPISIEQVVMNLSRNAFQAMQASSLQCRELLIRVSRVRENVQIEVIDTGTGIDQEVAERLFSPFFSTKAEGMGMGLNICRTIVEFHGGQLRHRPNPSGGTIFSFTVPVAAEDCYSH